MDIRKELIENLGFTFLFKDEKTGDDCIDNFTVWQRVNEKITGESVPLFSDKTPKNINKKDANESQPQQIDISGKGQSPKPESKEGSPTSPKPSEEGKGNGSPKEKVGEQPIGEAEAKNVVVKLSDLPSRAFAVAITVDRFDELKKKILDEGFTQPIIIDEETGNVLDGQRRLFVAESMGLKEVPAIYMNNPTREELNEKIKELESKNKKAEAKPKENVEPKQKEEKKEEPKKDNLADKARNKAAKLRSGEENVLPDWLRADLPKGTKKQGASINEAYAAALETFADVYEKAQDFKKAVDEAFKKLSDWYNENNIDFDEKDLKEKFEAEMQGKKQDDADQERRFTKQMLATESLLPKAEITKTLEYVKQSNALSIEQATKIIDEIGVDEAFGLVVSGSDINGGVRGVLGQMLISKWY